MFLHGKIMNLQVEKRKQNVAIDEALKSHKNLRDIMVAIYTRAHRDARHAAAEIAAEQSFAPDEGYCRCPITKTEAVLAGSLCPKCFRPRR